MATASNLAAKGRDCDSLREIDSLRPPLKARGSYIGGKVPLAAQVTDRGVEVVEGLLLAQKGMKACATRARRVQIVPTKTSPPYPAMVPTLPDTKGESKDQPDERGFLPRGNQPQMGVGNPISIQTAEKQPTADRAHKSLLGSTLSPAERNGAEIARVAQLTVPNSLDLGVPQRMGTDATGGLWEPQVASAPGGVVFYSGSYMAAYSLDGGVSFTFVDPTTMFRQDSGGFCCDTVLHYVPQINRFVWLIQYWCSAPDTPCNNAGSSNRYLLLVARPEDIRSDTANPGLAWRRYDITPAQLGETGGWFDFPNLAASANKLVLSWNVVGNGPEHGLVMWIDLSQLTGTGSIGAESWFTDGSFIRIAQNGGTQGFAINNIDYSHVRISTFTDASDVVFYHDIAHSQLPVVGYNSTAPGSCATGTCFDWVAARGPGARILGATRDGNQLWVLWGAGRCYGDPAGSTCAAGTRWPQPHLQLAVFDIPTLRLMREETIWNPQLAFAFASIATNSNDEVGLVFSLGGPSTNPALNGNATFGIGLLSGVEEFVQVMSASPGTASIPTLQGDYNGIDVDGADPTRFVAAGYAQINDSSTAGQRYHPVFVRFGR